MTLLENLHIYPAPIVNESRIFKQTRSVEISGLVSGVIICGTAQAGIAREERLSSSRRIERVGSTYETRSSSVISRVWQQVSWSRTVYNRYSQNNIGVVNAHSVAVLPVCYFLSRRLGAKLIYDTHELETETAAAIGVQGRIFKMIERVLINRCDAIFVVNQSIADWYMRRYPGLKPVVIRNIPNVDQAGETVNVRELLSIPSGKRLFIHVGNLVNGRGIQAILNAFASAMIESHVLFLGDGPLEPIVRNYASKFANIHALPAVPSADVVSYVAGCDAGFCLTQPSCLSHRLALPNKAFEYVAAGVPFFFTNLPEIRNLLGEAFLDWFIDDPSRNLRDAIAGLTANMIDEAKVELAALRLPTWDEEARVMLGTYSRLLRGA